MADAEIFWKIVHEIGVMAVAVGTGCCLCFLVRPFMLRQRFVGLVGVPYVVVLLILRMIPTEISNALAYAAAVGASGIVMCIIERRNYRQKIFLFVTFFLLRWISMGLATLIYRQTSEFFLQLRAVAALGIRGQFAFFVGMTLFHAGVHLVFVWLAVWIIRRVYVYREEELTGRELILYLFPSLSVMMGYIVLEVCERLYEADTHIYLADAHISYEYIRNVYQIISFVAIVGMIVIFQKVRSSQEERRQVELLVGQISQMKQHIAEVEGLYQDIRSLKHDMGNHLMTIGNLYQNQEREAAEEYAESLKKQWQKSVEEIHTGNPVTDVIVAGQKKSAQKKGIVFQCDFHYPEQTVLDVFDVSVILGNALTNALDAAEGCASSFVSLRSSRTKNAFLIEVRNRMAGTCRIDAQSGLPVTTKPGAGHGYGLANIRKVAEKYHGGMDICQENDTFLLRVLLNIM